MNKEYKRYKDIVLRLDKKGCEFVTLSNLPEFAQRTYSASEVSNIILNVLEG